MHVRQLSLTNFRNYAQQVLTLEPSPVLLFGENAQGKTNVLEAIFLLATGRAERAATDADYIAWNVREDMQPVARIVGTAVRSTGEVTVEMTIAGREGVRGMVASKRFKLNGVPRRQSDVAGAILAVLFTTDDMELVRGAPAGRRRYLDVMLGQVDHDYGRALRKYNKVITQRNALLKRLQERSGSRDELDYWDEELSLEGATIAAARANAVAALSEGAAACHSRLSGEREQFALEYAPRIAESWTAGQIAEAAPDELEQAMRDRLAATHPRDIGAGITLSGPHRDDLTMTIGGEAASSFASRGQQRTAALSLRLAEARFLHERANERPVLLLDDVLSELDESRRTGVLSAIDADQVLITSPDPDRFSAKFKSGAQCFRVREGVASPM